MDLKDFVKETLLQLSQAISESKGELKKKVVLTNTALRAKSAGNYGLIDFDLAVEAKSGEVSGKGAGLKISVLEANIGKNIQSTVGTVSRIKFTLEADF